MSSISPHFNNYSKSVTGEQALLEDLINETVYLAGAPIFYIARDSIDSIDWILGEDPTSKFERSWQLASYLVNVEDWHSGGDIFSKFGLNISKQTNIIVTRRHFNKYVPDSFTSRPREGDLVYIPVLQKLFEIKFVNKEQQFYTHGKVLPYFWELQLEMFKYSQEPIDTGHDEIDNIEPDNSYIIDLQLSTGTGKYKKDEIVYQGNDSLIDFEAKAKVKNWNSSNNILSVYNIQGVFESNVAIIGATSNASWIIGDYDPLKDGEEHRLYHNSDYQEVANTFFDRSEVNPFHIP